MILEYITNIDHYFFTLINQLAFKWVWLDLAGVFLAQYFPYFVGLILLLFLIRFKKNWLMVLKALLAAVFARFVIVEGIRLLRPRLRPFVSSVDINLLIDKVNQLSFPSGHAAFFFALSAVVFLNNRKAGILFFAFSFLISVARIFVGVHWPLDILAGAAVGILSGWLANQLIKNR